MSDVIKQPKNLTPQVQPVELTTLQQAEVRRKEMWSKERELVRGVFRDYECPGGKLEMMYKKYQEDPLEKFTLYDGQVATVPLGVARHLNTNCWYPEHGYKMDEMGNKVAAVSKKTHRYGFSSLDFMDSSDAAYSNSRIATVETLSY